MNQIVNKISCFAHRVGAVLFASNEEESEVYGLCNGVSAIVIAFACFITAVLEGIILVNIPVLQPSVGLRDLLVSLSTFITIWTFVKVWACYKLVTGIMYDRSRLLYLWLFVHIVQIVLVALSAIGGTVFILNRFPLDSHTSAYVAAGAWFYIRLLNFSCNIVFRLAATMPREAAVNVDHVVEYMGFINVEDLPQNDAADEADGLPGLLLQISSPVGSLFIMLMFVTVVKYSFQADDKLVWSLVIAIASVFSTQILGLLATFYHPFLNRNVENE